METLLVLYTIEDEFSVIPNGIMMENQFGREVQLLDILKIFLQSSIGINYTFWNEIRTVKGKTRALIRSPCDIVPVNGDGTICLHLEHAAAPPVIPIRYHDLYSRKSRLQIYSADDSKKACEQALRAGNENKWIARNQGLKLNVPALFSSSSPSRKKVAGGHDDALTEKGHTSSTSSSSTSSLHPQQAYSQSNINDKRSNIAPFHGSQAQENTGNGQPSSSTSTSNSRSIGANQTQFVNEETVTALTDAAKEAAGAVGRSLFSFAAGLKSVVAEAAAGATSAVAQAGGGGGGGSTGTLVPGSIVDVGSMKVIVISELGVGAYGTVYGVQDTRAARRYALKRLLCQSKEQITDARNELNVLNKLRGSAHVVSLVDSVELPSFGKKLQKEFLMIFPLYSLGTAWSWIESAMAVPEMDRVEWPFPEKRAVRVVIDVAYGLLYMHEKDICHRDVKCHNILLGDDGSNAVLTDLGSATSCRHEIKDRKQALNAEDEASTKTSAAYRAPELTSVSHPCVIDERVDVWALGCVMFALAYGRSPFETPRDGVMRLAILNGRYATPPQRPGAPVFSDEYHHIIKSMLKVDSATRPYVSDILPRLEALFFACG